MHGVREGSSRDLFSWATDSSSTREVIYMGPGGTRARDRRAHPRRPELRPLMAASSSTHPISARECSARKDLQQPGSPLPRGRAVAPAARREQRSPPPSARKRCRDASSDKPAGKRALRRSDDEHFSSFVLHLKSPQYPDKARLCPWEPSEGQQDTTADDTRCAAKRTSNRANLN